MLGLVSSYCICLVISEVGTERKPIFTVLYTLVSVIDINRGMSLYKRLPRFTSDRYLRMIFDEVNENKKISKCHVIGIVVME